MRFRNDICDASSRIEAASNLFDFKLRAAQEEFADLRSNWADTRADRFTNQYLKAQTETMQAGSAFLRESAMFAAKADESATEAERQLRQAYTCEAEAERGIENTGRLLRAAEDLAGRAFAEARRIADHSDTLITAISAAQQDPGW